MLVETISLTRSQETKRRKNLLEVNSATGLGPKKRFPTGTKELDHFLLGGFPSGVNVLIETQPHSGLDAFLAQTAIENAKIGRPVFWFSPSQPLCDVLIGPERKVAKEDPKKLNSLPIYAVDINNIGRIKEFILGIFETYGIEEANPIFIIDQMDGLDNNEDHKESTNYTYSKEEEANRARALTSLLRCINPILCKNNACIIFVCQPRYRQNGLVYSLQGPSLKALRHFALTILSFEALSFNNIYPWGSPFEPPKPKVETKISPKKLKTGFISPIPEDGFRASFEL